MNFLRTPCSFSGVQKVVTINPFTFVQSFASIAFRTLFDDIMNWMAVKNVRERKTLFGTALRNFSFGRIFKHNSSVNKDFSE